jgi:CTP:molybdopterin cytidylyltransferase MocA
MGCQYKQGGGLYARLRIGAVLLAAGEGRRMGGVSKPLIRLQGVPLIRRHLVALSGAGVDEVVVVTGHAREAVEAQVLGFPVTLAHNSAYADGQQGSVRVGLAALSGSFDAVFVALADQPMIGAGDLTELIGAFKKRPAGTSSCRSWPASAATRSCSTRSPTRRSWPATRTWRAGTSSERQPELVHVHETANTRFVVDLDTLQDVHALAARTGWRLELPELAAVG